MPQTWVLPRQVAIMGGVVAPFTVATFFQTGTSTPQSVYTDAALTNAVTSIVADSAGVFAKVYLNPNAAADYRVVLTPPTGMPYTEDDISRLPVSQADIGAILYPRTDAESAAGVTPTNSLYPPVYLDRYAVGDGVTDDTLALRKAQSVLEAQGGGTLVFGQGKTYLLATTGTYTVRVPASAANFQPSNQGMPYHVLMNGVGNIHWLGNGARLKSTITGGGSMFIMDGVRGFHSTDLTIESVTAKDVGGNVTTAGMQGFAITSQNRNAYNFQFTNTTAKNVYVPVYVFGDAASPYRVRGIAIDTLYHDQGVYTLAFHNNGDNVVAKGVHSSAANREYFVYGVDQHDVQISSDTAFAGFASNIKAYDRDTTRIRYSLRTTKSSTQFNVNLESQHAPAVQATPARLIDVHVDVNNIGNASNQVAVGFQYYQDSTPTATSANNLWTGIKLSGIHLQSPVINSTQIGGGLASYGTLNTDDLVLLGGAVDGLYLGTGFFDSKQSRSTYVPVLKFGGASTGITYGTRTGEYWRDGRFIEGHLRIVLTSKGSAVGSASIDLPIASSALNLVNAMIVGDGQANMAGLTGSIFGFVALNGTTMTLRQQGAAASASLSDTNFANTSDLRLWFRYPIS